MEAKGRQEGTGGTAGSVICREYEPGRAAEHRGRRDTAGLAVGLGSPPGTRQRERALAGTHGGSALPGDRGVVGEGLRYVATVDGQWVALLAWASAAWYCAPRDRWLGWTPSLRRPRLPFVANNTRFLILDDVRVPNLASAVLAGNTKRLAADWRRAHRHPVQLAETLVDPARFSGTAYRAADWLPVGLTHGYARRGGRCVHHGQAKVMWVRALVLQARARLVDAFSKPGQSGGGWVTTSKFHGLNWAGPGGLRERLATIEDPRRRRGMRHQWGPIILMACAAVVAGQKNFVEIAEWMQDLPQETLARFGARRVRDNYQAPSELTFRRTLQRANADRIDAVLGEWFASQGLSDAIAVDGKALRGSGHGQPAVHLLSAVLHQEGIVIGQQAVPDKTNEIPGLRTLLTPMDIVDRVVTADAMHAQDDTARFIVEDKQAHYMLQLKANQHSLLADVELLGPVEKGHGCIERRSVSARSALADYLAFPYAQQVIRVERTTWTLGPNVAAEAPLFHEVSFYLSDLTPEQAAARLGRPAPQGSPRDRAQHLAQANTEYLGGLIRGHRGIERHHWVRDRDFREDEWQVRRGAASQVMASLRNCAINPIRTLGVPNIAATYATSGVIPNASAPCSASNDATGSAATRPPSPSRPVWLLLPPIVLRSHDLPFTGLSRLSTRYSHALPASIRLSFMPHASASPDFAVTLVSWLSGIDSHCTAV